MKLKIGDDVQIDTPKDSLTHGEMGKITGFYQNFISVRLKDGIELWFLKFQLTPISICNITGQQESALYIK